MGAFDDFKKAAAPKPPTKHDVKSLGGMAVYVRDPSSADADEWRVYCHQNQGKAVPFAAKLCQLLLCTEDGSPLVPSGAQGLRELAGMSAAALDELSAICLPKVTPPTTEEVAELEKN